MECDQSPSPIQLRAPIVDWDEAYRRRFEVWRATDFICDQDRHSDDEDGNPEAR